MWARRLLTIGLLLYAAAQARDGLDAWIESTEMPVLVADVSTEVHDRNGRLLRAYTVADGRWRLATTVDGVDPRYVDMLVRFEDHRFYEHNGVDLWAMGRAVGQAIGNGRIVSGGSTLSMQVARLLEDGSTGRWDGKLRQIRLALALERRLSKDQILALYLNRAPFGGNLEGVRAASIAYFGKPPHRLTAAQSALLVALPQSPERRRPDRHPQAAQQARDRVLARMVRDGVLDAQEAAAARRDPVPTTRAEFPRAAPHLADLALAKAPLRSVHRLTLDRDLQNAMAQLARDAVANQGNRMQIAMVLADHQTGEILASVGSSAYQADHRLGFVDMTRAVRSPGSTLKPLVYGLAFDQGLAHPETLVEDRPVAFGAYVPQNFDGLFRGRLRVREALQLSLNIPVVSITEAIGPANLLAGMRRAGMAPKLPGGAPGLAVALGGVGVELNDLVALYAGIAQGGLRRDLYWQTDAEPARNGARFLSPVAAWYISDILAGVAPPSAAPADRLAYKTGTSYGHRDAWAIGFDGRYVAGVWMGRADGTAVPGVFGGELAAPVLFDLFARLPGQPVPLPPPPAAALTVVNAQLPQPLQEFRPRDAAFEAPAGGPQLAFPPDGARLALAEDLVVKVRDGTAPFTWLLNGEPQVTRSFVRQSQLPHPGAGFATISVIDAEGRSARATVFLEMP